MRSSMVASRRGMSLSISAASAGKLNSIVAEIRESVVNGATVSGSSGGLSAAKAVEQRPIKPSAARPARADRPKATRRRGHNVETVFITLPLFSCLIDQCEFDCSEPIAAAAVEVKSTAHGAPLRPEDLGAG